MVVNTLGRHAHSERIQPFTTRERLGLMLIAAMFNPGKQNRFQVMQRHEEVAGTVDACLDDGLRAADARQAIERVSGHSAVQEAY